MYQTLKDSNLPLPLIRRGKVRDVYDLGNKLLLVTTDRISAFDKVLNQPIPHKGECLNNVSAHAFYATAYAIPNHLMYTPIPDPNVMVVYKTDPIPAECIVRGYLAGSALAAYREGKRKFFTETLPDGIKPYEKLKHPILTPTTKAEKGHDINIDTLEGFRDIVGECADELIEKSIKLYQMGDSMANENGGILVDTKFEFGLSPDNEILVIDELFTHDSSRFVIGKQYEKAFKAGKEPRWVDKEFARNYLKSIGFKGDGPVPDLPKNVIKGVTKRVIEASYLITGAEFSLPLFPPTDDRIIRNLKGRYL